MFPSPRLGLLALLRGIGSIGYILKSFILRCLLFRPHILRSFRRICSLCSGTSPKDVSKKKGGNARPSFPGAPGGCEGYSTICASRDSGWPHSQLGPGNTEDLLLSPMTAQSQSAPHSPASMHPPSLHSSPQLSNRQFSASSASIADSHNTESRPPPIRYLDAPLTSTHSRVTSTQFGAPSSGRRSRSRSRSRHPHTFPQSSTPGTPTASPVDSRAPSLRSYPDPQLQPLPRSSSPGSTQTPRAEPTLQDTSEGYRQLGLEITFSPPSRSQTADSQSPFDFPQPPLPLQPGHLSGLSQIPTASAEHSTPNPLDLGGSGSLYLMPVPGGALLSSGSLPPTPSSNQVPSLRFHSQVSFRNTLTTDASGNWSDKKERVLRPMHSEQVSRYVNKNDVSSKNGEYKLHPMQVDLPRLYEQRPKGWEPATHPGGALYFYNAKRRIFTDVYMYDNKLSTEIHLFAAYLDEHRQTASRSRWPFPTNDYDLVLDIIKMEDDEVIGAYYYVDHVTKTLFWQGHYDCKDSFLCDVRGGPREPGHVSPYFSCLSINTVRITARSKTGGPLRTNGQ